MFTREEAVAALVKYYGGSEDAVGIFYESLIMEPDGIIVYHFCIHEGLEGVCVYRDSDGVNIVAL